MREEMKNMLSYQCYGKKTSVEFDHNDTELSEVIHAFYTLMIGATYSPESVLRGMIDFAEDYLGIEHLEPAEDFIATTPITANKWQAEKIENELKAGIAASGNADNNKKPLNS